MDVTWKCSLYTWQEIENLHMQLPFVILFGKCCDHIFTKIDSDWGRRYNTFFVKWTVKRCSSPALQNARLLWVFLLKLTQVYERCSSADALKIGARISIQSAFDYLGTLALSCNHQTTLSFSYMHELSSQQCIVTLRFFIKLRRVWM